LRGASSLTFSVLKTFMLFFSPLSLSGPKSYSECIFKPSKLSPGQVPVAHTCNCSFSGGRDQRQLEQIAHETLSQKTPITKKGWLSGSRCRPWVQTPVLQKKIPLSYRSHHHLMKASFHGNHLLPTVSPSSASQWEAPFIEHRLGANHWLEHLPVHSLYSQPPLR
jgi:hypothetical protein